MVGLLKAAKGLVNADPLSFFETFFLTYDAKDKTYLYQLLSMHLALIHPLKFVFSNDACLFPYALVFAHTHTHTGPLAPGESITIHID